VWATTITKSEKEETGQTEGLKSTHRRKSPPGKRRKEVRCKRRSTSQESFNCSSIGVKKGEKKWGIRAGDEERGGEKSFKVML